MDDTTPPNRIIRPRHTPTPKMSDRKKSLFSTNGLSRRSSLIRSTIDEDLDLGPMSPLQFSSSPTSNGSSNGSRCTGITDLLKVEFLDPMHTMGDVKTVLRSWILGMGEIKMPKTRSICIAGPPGCGKKFLAYALMDEMGAVMMDLSPKIFAQFENNAPEMIDKISKMAKILAPTVFFIDGAHYPFVKKMVPADPMRDYNPQLIGQYLPKLLKGITIDQKIMLIGTTNEPWNSQMGKMKKTFEKIILCPNSEYGSTVMAWQKGLRNKNGIDRDMNVSALSKVTQFYGTRQILENCDKVVNIRRKARLHIKPMTCNELLEGLLISDAPECFAMPENIRDKYFKWFSKINKLAKERAAVVAKHRKQVAAEAKKQKK